MNTENKKTLICLQIFLKKVKIHVFLFFLCRLVINLTAMTKNLHKKFL